MSCIFLTQTEQFHGWIQRGGGEGGGAGVQLSLIRQLISACSYKLLKQLVYAVAVIFLVIFLSKCLPVTGFSCCFIAVSCNWLSLFECFGNICLTFKALFHSFSLFCLVIP